MRVPLLAVMIAVTVAAAGGALWLTMRRIAPRELSLPSIPPDIQVRFDRITVRGRAEGGRRWELEARSVELTRDQSLTRLDGLRHATLYAGDKPQLSVRAAWAKLESPSRNMELGGGVEVTSPAGLMLRTDRLLWRAQDERLDTGGAVEMRIGDTAVRAPRAYYLARSESLVCEGGVRIKQGPNYLSGERLTADLGAETLEIAGDVRMRMRVAEGQEFAGTEGPLGAMQGLLEKVPKEGR
jgi:LPS export ABC transporter protein LptC